MRVHVLSQRTDVPLRASRYAASFHSWSPANGDRLLDRVAAVSRAVGADVCMAVDEGAIRALACRAGDLPFRAAPIPSVVHFDAAYDKWHLARVLSKHRLPHPTPHLAGSDEAAAAMGDAARFPVLLKPRRGSNGIGIARFRTPDALRRHFSSHPTAAATTVVQQEIQGRDIDCSVLCDDGEVLAYTIQRAIGPGADRFQPSRAVEFVAHDEVLRVVKRLMAVLKWNGVAHVDLREHAATRRVDIIEVNPRFWGSLLGSLHAGVNFPQLTALTALGLPHPGIDYRRCRYAGGTFAVSAWLHTAVTGCASGIGLRETPFVHALADPGPHVVEMIDRCRRFVSRSVAPVRARASAPADAPRDVAVATLNADASGV